MFIVNQNGDKCEKIENIKYDLNYDKTTRNELDKIRDKIYKKSYNLGSMKNCLNTIKKEQTEYLADNKCKKILHIYVNGCIFAIFKDIDKGINIFDEILACIKENNNLFNLSEKKYLEVETSKN